MICDWIFLSSQLRTFTNCRPFIEIRLPFIFFLFESFLKVVSVAKFFCSWLLIPNNGAGSIQSVMVSCVREIKECTHFSLGENIWSSPLLRFWHLKVEWLCWQLSTEVGRNAWEMRSGFFFWKADGSDSSLSPASLHTSLLRVHPALLSAAAAGYLLRAFHTGARDSGI